MASCGSCKKRTISFCYIHKSALCDDCIVQPKDRDAVRCEPNCVIRNYFDWLVDGSYEWPVKCSVCNRSINSDPHMSQRLVCKCLYHRQCLADTLRKQQSSDSDSSKLHCINCQTQVYNPAVQPRSKLRDAVQAFVSDLSSHSESGREEVKEKKTDSTTLSHSPSLSPTLPTLSQSLRPPPSQSLTPEPTLTYSESERAPLLSQPSRQRLTAPTVLRTSSTDHSIEIAATPRDDEKKHSHHIHSHSHSVPQRVKPKKKRRWRLDRVIACVMLTCFIGSIVVYLALSQNWISMPKRSTTG